MDNMYDNETIILEAEADPYSVADVAMAALGLSHIAYIRPAQNEEGVVMYAVCAADGSELASFSSYDSAFFTARQYNLQPVRVH